MSLKDQLAALTREADELLEKHKAGEFTAGDHARTAEIVKERETLKEKIAEDERVTAALKAASSGGAIVSSREDTPEEGPARDAGKTLGQLFVESKSRQVFKDRHPEGRVTKGDTVDVRFKAAPGARAAKLLTTGETGNAAPVRVDDVDNLVYRPERTLLDLITVGTTDLPWFEYRQVVSITNNAAIVPEATSSAPIDGTDVTEAAGGLKPISTLTTKTADAKAFTYADGMEVTNQELADDGAIRTLIDSTLRENLEIHLEHMIINGAGGSDEPTGILNTTGVIQQAFDTDAPTSVRKAITKLRVTSGAQIQALVLNPEDDEAWDLMKNLEGDYMGNGPFAAGPPTAWGYPRVESQAVPVGQALIGDFRTIHLLQKDPLEILAFNQHKDFAQRNLSYIRAELRALQLIRNAARIAVVDLTAG